MLIKQPKSPQSVFGRTKGGLLRLESSGVYYARFKHAGKTYKKCLHTSDRRHAQRLLAEFRLAVENVTSKEAGRVTFAEIAQRWLASVRHTLKPSTVTRRETCIANLEPYFRAVTLSGIKPEHCEKWKNGRGEKIAPQTFAHELGTMKLIFEFAVERGILYRNPARAIKRRRIIATRKKNIPTREQFSKLVAAIRESDGRKESQAAAKNGADLLELITYSGMRIGEAVSIKWEEVNFEKNYLTVTGGENMTKNYKTRNVPLSRELKNLLLRLRESAKPQPADEIAKIASPKKCLQTACAKLGLPRFTPHNFRDFFGTTCLEARASVHEVARWMGHSDGGAQLLKTYAHEREEHSQAQMKKIIFGAISPQK